MIILLVGRAPGVQGETPWQSLLARLVEMVQEVRACAAHGAGFTSNFP
ncbi:hypothetical protein ACIQ1J_33725 [Streptomyces sp. NPDC097107]